MATDINNYFAGYTYTPQPEPGSAPTNVAWTAVGELRVLGARIYAGDSWAIAADGVSVPVPPGVYTLVAECYAYGQDARVARLRGLLPGRTHSSSVLAGRFGVDVASAGVIDADALERWATADPDGFDAWCDAFVDSRIDDHGTAGFFDCPEAGVSMVHISTGFGDGYYAVHQLLDGAEVVGFELEFLKPGQGYFTEWPEDDG